MKSILSIILAILVFNAGNIAAYKQTEVVNKSSFGGFTSCNDCVTVMSDTINDLIGIIMNTGVMASCNDLCDKLTNHAENIACMLTCVYFGLNEFTNIIMDMDPDPIYMCEVIDICPVNLKANGTVTGVEIIPTTGPAGSTFYALINYTITSEFGTGQIAANLYDVVGDGYGFYNLLVETQPGEYSVTFPFSTVPTDTEPFNPGNYMISVGLCEGFCGSPHKDTIILSVVNQNFTLTN